MITKVYLLRALTNLHPGKGDSNYGVVDKLVQRDPINDFPTIHMSGIKGAMRQYFEEAFPNNAQIETIFGSSPQSNSNKIQPGELRFLSADLLAIPIPSEDENVQSAYKLYAHPETLKEWLEKAKYFGANEVNLNSDNWQKNAKKFEEAAKDLPVIARNYLDHGESKNLWYEEIVPRESLFACIIQGPSASMNFFDTGINEKVIQIGGNATVGYGYCLFKSIN
jgi:CRISPR-associated protein Cmr4